MLLFLFLLGLALGAASPSEDPQVKLERQLSHVLVLLLQPLLQPPGSDSVTCTKKEAGCGDGCEAKFFFWYGGVPSDAGSHCVYINWNRKWHDMQCSETFPSVCASRITCV
ncbi:hypothetical protein KUCAC02_013442 [Chaenocephalus aceratus]|nr:hypothetical protein KUCAC02_013442 [Chaenocephalus aceratus]